MSYADQPRTYSIGRILNVPWRVERSFQITFENGLPMMDGFDAVHGPTTSEKRVILDHMTTSFRGRKPTEESIAESTRKGLYSEPIGTYSPGQVDHFHGAVGRLPEPFIRMA